MPAAQVGLRPPSPAPRAPVTCSRRDERPPAHPQGPQRPPAGLPTPGWQGGVQGEPEPPSVRGPADLPWAGLQDSASPQQTAACQRCAVCLTTASLTRLCQPQALQSLGGSSEGSCAPGPGWGWCLGRRTRTGLPSEQAEETWSLLQAMGVPLGHLASVPKDPATSSCRPALTQPHPIMGRPPRPGPNPHLTQTG